MFLAIRKAGDYLLDNAGGAQVLQAVVDAVANHLYRLQRAAHGELPAQAMGVDSNRQGDSVAMLVNAYRPDEISFAERHPSSAWSASASPRCFRNATTSSSPPRTTTPTSLPDTADGAKIVRGGMREMASFTSRTWPLNARTRLVACTVTAHSIGTWSMSLRFPVTMAPARKRLGIAYYGPHAPIDAGLGSSDHLRARPQEFLAAYGASWWGRYEALKRLPTLAKISFSNAMSLRRSRRSAPSPRGGGRHGRRAPFSNSWSPKPSRPANTAARVVAAMAAIRDHETVLVGKMLAVLARMA